MRSFVSFESRTYDNIWARELTSAETHKLGRRVEHTNSRDTPILHRVLRMSTQRLTALPPARRAWDCSSPGHRLADQVEKVIETANYKSDNAV